MTSGRYTPFSHILSENETSLKKCCEACQENEVSCPVKECKHWIDYEDDLNCTLIAVEEHGRLTLRETADRLGISFVRVKQIEDKALKKLHSDNLSMKRYLFKDKD